MKVTVLAPDGNRSGCSRIVSWQHTVTVKRRGGSSENPIYACSGSPVDCVRIGIFSERFTQPDVIVAGINHGINVGDDATYSGTLGAAIEGALLGRSAIAFSQQDLADDLSLTNRAKHVFDLAWLVPDLVDAVVNAVPVPRVVVNVNFPNCLRERRISLTRLAAFTYDGRWMNSEVTAADEWTFWPYLGAEVKAPALETSEQADTGALMLGRISLTPLCFEWSTPPTRRQLAQWASLLVQAGERALARANTVDRVAAVPCRPAAHAESDTG
jgi:5'-nucleotidase